MNRDQDLDRRLRGWFVADERDLPESVRVAALASVALIPQRHRRRLPYLSIFATRQHRLQGAATLGLLLALLIAALLLPLAGSSPPPPRIVNGWIAFSSQPHAGQDLDSGPLHGGDIYLAHDHDDIRMLVSRGMGMDSNVCPAFSPDGTRLAYGKRTDEDPGPGGLATAVVILDLAADGSITHTSRLPIVPTMAEAPCPRWSTDGMRIGSLEGGSVVVSGLDRWFEGGSVVVRGLDGSILEPRDGDPTLADFTGYIDDPPLDSPSGELIARRQDGVLIVQSADGSPDRTIDDGNPYTIGGWSPDSTKVLLFSDTGLDFELTAVSVDEPFAVEVIAESIPVNGGRSWPDRRDLSWQTLAE